MCHVLFSGLPICFLLCFRFFRYAHFILFSGCRCEYLILFAGQPMGFSFVFRRVADVFLIIRGADVFVFTTVFAYAKRELWNRWRFEAILPSLLQSIRCKQKAVDRWLADLHVTLLSV